MDYAMAVAADSHMEHLHREATEKRSSSRARQSWSLTRPTAGRLVGRLRRRQIAAAAEPA